MREVIIESRSPVNAYTLVTQEMRDAAAAMGTPIPQSQNYILDRDRRGRVRQNIVVRKTVLRGRQLDVAVRRAVRWLQNNPDQKRPPSHIARGIVAMQQMERDAD